MTTFNIEDYYSSDLRPVEEAQLLKITEIVGWLVAAADAKRDAEWAEACRERTPVCAGRKGKKETAFQKRIDAAIRANPGLSAPAIGKLANCSDSAARRRIRAIRDSERGEGV